MNTLLKCAFSLLLLIFLNACASNEDRRNTLINWGYAVGDPILDDGGYTGNFYPYASPYGQNHPAVVYENEGAVAP